MSEWTEKSVEQFATEFAAAQAWIANAIEHAGKRSDEFKLLGLEAKQAADHLESAFDNLPEEVRARIVSVRTAIRKDETAKPPVRKVTRDD